MPFKRVFERKLNDNMREAEGSASAGEGRMDDEDKSETKKQKLDDYDSESEAEDIEMSERKKHKKDSPPRFSTLFEEPAHQQFFDLPPAPRTRKAITVPFPVFIVLAVTLFFESTLLFAYTVIGLYNNLPPQLSTSLAAGGIATACDCSSKQPSINIAPNFFVPEEQAGTGGPLTLGSPVLGPDGAQSRGAAISTHLPVTSLTPGYEAVQSNLISMLEQALTRPVASSTTTSSSSTSSSSSSTTTADSSKTTPTSSNKLSTVTPTVTSVSLVTVGAPSVVTSTSFTGVAGSTVTSDTTLSPTTNDSKTTTAPPPSTGTATTPKSTTTVAAQNDAGGSSGTSVTSTATSSQKLYGGYCAGGAGAVEQVCASGPAGRK